MTYDFDLEHIDAAAGAFLQAAGDSRVFALYGEMGAGKTTFVKAVCARLGVESAVNSPTFAIINEYRCPLGPVYHFDFYRLKNAGEAFDIGCDDYFYSGDYCFMEWPEKLEDRLPDNASAVRLSVLPDGRRRLELDDRL